MVCAQKRVLAVGLLGLLGTWLTAAQPAWAQLTIAEGVGPDPVRAGEILHVELTATNLGGAAVANVSIQVDLPAQVLSFNQAYTSNGGTCTGSGNLNATCEAGETITWTIGTLGAGARATVTFAPQVPAGAFTPPNGTVISYAARVRANAVTQASTSETATVQSVKSFEVALDASADPIAPGALLRYTPTFSNLTGTSVANAALTLTLPSGVTFVSASSGGSFAAGVVTWNLGTLPPGYGATHEVVVTVDAVAAEGAVLQAAAGIQAPTLLSARAQSIAVVQSGGALLLEIEVGPRPIRAAETGVVELTVSNTGAAIIDPVVELRIDEHVLGFSNNFVTQGGNCLGSGNLNATCEAREILRFDVPALAPGERITLQLAPQIPAGSFTPLDGSIMPWRAIAYEPLIGQAGESTLVRQNVVIDSTPLFELALDESADPALPGGELIYTLTYSNVTGASVAAVSLRLALPPGAAFVSASDGGTHASGVVSWNIGTLPAGVGGTRQVRVMTDGLAAEGALLRADARIVDSSAAPISAWSSAVGALQSNPTLLLEIEASPDPVRAAETMIVELTATNLGPNNVDPVVDLRIDEHTLGFNQSVLSQGGACTGAGNLNATCESRELIRWDLPPLAPGERVTVQAVPQIPAGSFTPPTGTILVLRAEAFEPVAGVIGPRRHATQSVLVHSARALELALDDSLDPIEPDRDLTFTVTYSNPGAGALPGVVLELPLPAGTSFVAANGGGTHAAGVVSWNLGTLPSGLGGTRQATVHVDAAAAEGTQLRPRARIRDGSALPAEARAASVSAVQAGPSLLLEIEADPDAIRATETADVLLTVSNAGSQPVDGILELRVDEETLAFVQNFLTHGGTCSHAGNLNPTCDVRELIRWDLPVLAAGERMTVALAPQVPGGSFTPANGTVIPWRAEVFEQLPGEVGVRRMARQSVLVNSVAAFELALDAALDSTSVGGDVVYTATFGNVSGQTAVSTTLALPIPAGMTFVSANGGGTVVGGEVRWNLGSIPSGRGGKRSATLHAGASLTGGEMVRTVAEIRDSAASPNSARAVAAVVLQTSPGLAFVASAVPNPAQPVNFLDVDFTLTNTSAQAKSNLIAEVRFPGSFLLGVTQASATPVADCTVSGNLDTNCAARERVQWTLANLAAAAQSTFSFGPQVSAGSFTPPNGTLIRFVGIADGSQAVATHTVRIGISEDEDGDGFSDWLDNCPFQPNDNQADIGGVGAASGPDGIGDACQCGDVSGNGRVTTADATLMTRSLLVPPTAALLRPDLCNVGGSAACTTADAVIVTRALLVPPTATVLQVCPAAIP